MEAVEYNEVYGWMPQDIINNLDVTDRNRMFLEYLMRQPTEAGWKIVNATVKELGDPFIIYVLKSTLQEGDVTRENVVEMVKEIFHSFACDLNSFAQYVDNYLEETGDSENDKPQKPLPQRDSKGRFIKKQ